MTCRSDRYGNVALGDLVDKKDIASLDREQFAKAPKEAMQHALNVLRSAFASSSSSSVYSVAVVSNSPLLRASSHVASTASDHQLNQKPLFCLLEGCSGAGRSMEAFRIIWSTVAFQRRNNYN
jgi:hypothetical protein